MHFEESFFEVLSATSADATMGAVVTPQEPKCENDGVAMIMAIPTEGHHFVAWNDGVTANPRVLTVTQDTAFVATFAADSVSGDAGEGGAGGSQPSAVPVESVTLTASALSMQTGTTQTLFADVQPANATNKAVNWFTSNPAVATVTDGVVTAVAEGMATIVVTTADGGFMAYCQVEVADPVEVVPVTGISLSESSIRLQAGNMQQLTATVMPLNATNQTVSWLSTNPAVATVSAGMITAVAEGATTIVVTTAEGGYAALCQVEVVNPVQDIAVEGISLSAMSIELKVGEMNGLTANIAPLNATNKQVSWLSTKPAVASVEDGIVRANAVGFATIVATTADGGYAAFCQVQVTDAMEIIHVSDIALNETYVELQPGFMYQLKATISPADATNTNVNWQSTDASVVGVNDGTLTALKDGTATIIATTVDGGLTAFCNVRVNTPSDLDEVEAEGNDGQVRKVVENGHVYILRGGVKYTITGQRVE